MTTLVRLLGAGLSAAESIRMEKAYLLAINKQFGSDKVKEVWAAYVDALFVYSASPASVRTMPLPVSASVQTWACVRNWKIIDETGRIAAGFGQTAGHFELFIPISEALPGRE